MKLNHIFASLVAICALAVGCTKTYPTHLEYIQLSQSTIGLDAAAERTVKVDVTADSAWKFVTDIPSWLKVSPVEGPVGKTTVTFAAAAPSNACQSATLQISCGGQIQYVYVQQGKGAAVNTAETAFTTDEAIAFYNAGGEGSEIYVKGTVKSASISLSYGNADFYLETGDGTTFELYRCYDIDGENFTDAGKVQAGDVVTACGTLTHYNSTIELGQGCHLVSISKSLVKIVDASSEYTAPAEESVIPVRLIKSGDNLDITIPSDVDWLSIAGTQTVSGDTEKSTPDTTVVNLKVAANDGKGRSASVSFTSAASGQSSTVAVSVSQEGGNIDIKDVVLGNSAHVIGQVTAICKAGFILTDATASILYYNKSYAGGFAIGDMVEIRCSKVTAYNKGLQLDNSNCTQVENLGAGTYSYPAPKVMTAADVDAAVATTTDNLATYVSLSGQLSISSGKYFNIAVDGTSNQGSIYQITDELKAVLESGKSYEFRGYLSSVSSGKYVNIVVTEAIPILSYNKVAAVTSGKSYLLVFADTLALNNLAESKSYGYPTASACKAASGVITGAFPTCEYVFTAVEGGYNITDSYGRYMYMYKDGAKSFNVKTELPATPVNCGVWTVSIDESGTATVKNLFDSSWIQYSVSFKSAGSYKTAQTGALMPVLYEKE